MDNSIQNRSELIKNVEVEYDQETKIYIARYTGLDIPVSTCGDDYISTVAGLSNAVATYLENRGE